MVHIITIFHKGGDAVMCYKIILRFDRSKGILKRGRPKLTWAEGIRGLMGEKGLMEEDWNDRSKWRKRIL
jgi:hypothetical protein